MLSLSVVWLALAQGSGELIWWLKLIAKYRLGFLFLLIPACSSFHSIMLSDDTR
ncbi:MAG: hypothetical protein NZ805_09345 [Armatimonadetes bacterium]|nr:hypothetical protein [Armatimonadota bacterium]